MNLINKILCFILGHDDEVFEVHQEKHSGGNYNV